MLKVETPEKYLLLKTPDNYLLTELQYNDVQRSYQALIDSILDFKESRPHATFDELAIYTMGVIRGRTKQVSHRRK